MPTPEGKLTLKEFYETFSEEEKVTITVPLDLKSVDSESYELVNTYNSYLANNQYEEAYNYRVENSAKLEPLIFDAQKANILQMLAIGSYQYVKGEKSAENTSYDNSNTGIEADTVQEAIDLILNSNATTLATRLSNIEEKLGNLYFKYVTSLPDSPDANTIYILPDKIYLGSKLIVSNNSNEVVYSNGTSVYAKINSLENTINTLESNFSTATNDLGTLLVAKGVEVPNGSSILDMISLLDNVTFISTLNPIEIFSTDVENLSGGWTNTNIDTGKCTSSVGNASGDTNNYINLTDVSNISVSLYAEEEKEQTPLRCILYLISEDGVVNTVATKSIENGASSTVFNISDYNGRYKIRVGVQVTYAPYSSTAQIYVKGVKLY